MTEKKKSKNAEVDFEKAVERLEKIVEQLESGDLKLEDALKFYEEAVGLSSELNQKLDQAEKKIKILTKKLGGKLEEADFEAEDDQE